MPVRRAIPCEIAPGMFGSERIIWFRIGSLDHSYFVEAESVKDSGDGSGWVLVDLLRDGADSIVVVPDAARTRIGVRQPDLVGV